MFAAYVFVTFLLSSAVSWTNEYYSVSWGLFNVPIGKREPCASDHRLLLHGDDLKLIPCVDCECDDDGNSFCTFQTCPNIECDGVLQKPAKQCCASCVGQVIKETPPTDCSWRGNTYRDGQKFSLGPCVDCSCDQGTGVCEVKDCPK